MLSYNQEMAQYRRKIQKRSKRHLSGIRKNDYHPPKLWDKGTLMATFLLCLVEVLFILGWD